MKDGSQRIYVLLLDCGCLRIIVMREAASQAERKVKSDHYHIFQPEASPAQHLLCDEVEDNPSHALYLQRNLE